MTIESLTRLSEIAAYIRTYQASTSATGKRDALTNASLTAAHVRKLAEYTIRLESVLVSRVAQNWFDLIAEEQAMLAAPREVRHIRNMYLVGRPVQPDSGHPFVGRNDQFETIDRLWRDATLKPPIVLHGQRRTGKTSILYHLEKNLRGSYLTVYANLQSLAAVETTSAFVYNLCDEIARRLRKAGLDLVEPQPADFAVEAFSGLRHFLNQVEDATSPDRWVVVLLDEFEMIEEKIKDRKIQSDVLYQFRDAMLNRPRFAIVLAGLHTLDQMTRDYWSPFFNGARNVKVSYLDDAAAKLLITNPWDGFELEYDQDALQFIADVAGCQPTLLQAVGAALIDRVNVRLEREGAQYQPRVTQADVDAVLGEVQQTSTYFDAVWHELGENERCILSALAKAQTAWNEPVSRADINTRVCEQLAQAEITQAWDWLKQRDMLEETNGQVKFRVELVRRWVASRP
ncbi:MAG: ATP-binding protein [Thermoflexales bacterium]|nr:ATP-binding protein [Thermoflexales bacterium]